MVNGRNHTTIKLVVFLKKGNTVVTSMCAEEARVWERAKGGGLHGFLETW